MPPIPPGPNATELLQGLFEDKLEPADLMQRSLELKKLSGHLASVSADGQVGAVRLLNYGQGDLADVISESWVKYFIEVGVVAAKAAEASACLDSWATTLGASQLAMAGVVAEAEAAIAAYEAARPAYELAKIDVDALIEKVKTAAKEQIRAISDAAMGAIAAVPSWAGQIPAGLSMPGGNGASSSTAGPTPLGAQQSATPMSSSSAGPTTESAPAPAESASSSSQGPSSGGAPSTQPGSNSTAGPTQGGTTSALSAQSASSSTSAPGTGGGASSLPGGGSSSAGGPSSATPSGGSAGTPASSGSPAAASSSSTPSTAPTSSAPSSSSTPSGSPASSTTTGGAPAQSPAADSAPVTAASGHQATSSAGPASTAAGVSATGTSVAPMSAGLASAGAAPSAAVSPVSAAASPIASAAAGAVPAPPPVPPAPTVSPVSPVSPGSALAPPPPAVAPPGVHAPAVSGPAAGSPTPPPQSAAPSPASSASSTGPSPNSATPISHSSQTHQYGPPASDRGGATPLVPLSGGHDPLIVPAAFVAPPPPFEQTFINEDLAAVRITLEAVGGSDHVQWAAGMVAVSGRKHLVVTSDRGRGWMPINAVLPANIELPWNHSESARWEGLIDPARVIVEYAAAVGGTLTALASTLFSPPGVASNVPFAYVDATERAHPELLTSSILRGPTATRVELQVSPGLRQKARAITAETAQRLQALSCAFEAHNDAETLSHGVWHSDVRQRLFSTLIDNQTTAPARIAALHPLWEELDSERRTLRDLEHAARVDVRTVAVGQLDNGNGEGLPYLMQGYATEAALGLLIASAASAFSNALYQWAMLRKYLPASDAVAS